MDFIWSFSKNPTRVIQEIISGMVRHIPKINKNAGRKYILRENVSYVLLYEIFNSLDHEMVNRNYKKTSNEERTYFQSEAIPIYMEEVKKDLMKNLDIDIKDDMSMVSSGHTNEEEDARIACGEGQDVDDEEIDHGDYSQSAINNN
ncbi:hypothetical protein H5410_062785 [Solanum commersonii]|uniref:Uncharacterized protein n=1 Tax=Solanum commersonii TaxID=4109 RepID=A0A9J5WBC7_SOLCO|nr:hypothetical protein H5410_062785 [Solanum commersonii]